MERTANAPTTIGVDEGEVYEVFQQDQKDPVPHHGGNLRAPDAELAIHFAKEFYGRRQESQRLWIVPRAALWEIADVRLSPVLPSPLLKNSAIPAVEAHWSCAVFGQKQDGKPFVWIQDVEGTSIAAVAEEAVQLVRQFDNGYQRLWLCPRSMIMELTNPDLLQPPLDRSYRRLDGYNIREKLRMARQRVQAEKEQQG